ncbi:LOW QUALITY PROTEIN: band 4.1-like protein 4 [Limulus polyphemus]|uniref:LOW QUALITY PROTEIN: band 4.1-like protein 4 n=1 Tax=Limulus polyphemus TaxID=6850 RepID=A0ABM1SRW5_LIMPO|nr:LOW QUALITY PROTEIN: band 4.1-like protein 4 [Limulus polyphemus]
MKCFGEKPKTRHCKIILLDETELIQEIQDTTRGQDLLDVVFKHLNLLETAYFGLRFVDSSGQTHWLDPTKNVAKQLKGTTPCTLYFNAKFYASDPCKLLEEITRYQFFLQVKQDILQGRLPVSFDLAAELFAYSVQSELGDYDHRRHQPGYISEFRFISNQTPNLEAKVAELHKNLSGKVPATAELNFLERVRWLDMYGVDLHPVLGEDNIEYFLGLTPSGVIVLRNKTKVGNYFWPRITKVYFKGKYFMLRVRDKNNDENTYGFELPSKQACKHLWKCCVEHHAFFRLTQVREVPGSSGKMFSLSSRFRYSGRTQKQMQLDLQQNRPPPTVTRVPSRRYQKRLGQPDGADAGSQMKEEQYENSLIETKSNISIPQVITPLASMYRSTSVPSALPFSDSPCSARSAPWVGSKHRGMYSNSTNPSPRSVKSAGGYSSSRFRLHQRNVSVESDSSCDSRRRRHHRSRKSSDNDSEVSKSSRGSKVSKSSRNSSSNRRSHHRGGGSGSESEGQKKHKKHHRRHKSGSTYELVDSEAQWKLVQQQQQQNKYLKPQNAVVRDLSSRKSGYHNSGMETESEATFLHKKKHRRHRSRSKSPDNKKGLSEELKKHIEYSLIDPENMTEEEKRNIKYTKVETDSRLFKIRYSPSSGQAHRRVTRVPSKNSSEQSKNKTSVGDNDSPPPPYTENGSMPQGASQPSSYTSASYAITTQLSDNMISGNNSKTITNSKPSSGMQRVSLSLPVPGTTSASLVHSGGGFVQARMIPPKINHSFVQNPDSDTKNNGSILQTDYNSSLSKLQNLRTHNGNILINGHVSSTPVSPSPRVTFQTPLQSVVGKSFGQPYLRNQANSRITTELSKAASGDKSLSENNLEMSTEL